MLFNTTVFVFSLPKMPATAHFFGQPRLIFSYSSDLIFLALTDHLLFRLPILSQVSSLRTKSSACIRDEILQGKKSTRRCFWASAMIHILISELPIICHSPSSKTWLTIFFSVCGYHTRVIIAFPACSIHSQLSNTEYLLFNTCMRPCGLRWGMRP